MYNTQIEDKTPQAKKNDEQDRALSAGMDRRLSPKKNLSWKKFGLSCVIGAFVVLVIYIVYEANEGQVLKVNKNRLDIAAVQTGVFEDFIPIRARVTPLSTVYLDAIEGGRVEERLVEDGSLVEKGQLILRLSNTSLQLALMRNEAEVIQQLNNMRTIELDLEQNRLSHEIRLVEINYQLVKLTRLVERQRKLIEEGSLAHSQLDETEDELNYINNLKTVTLESKNNDIRLQKQQLESLKSNAKRLEDNLIFAKNNIEKLNVRATVAGKLSGLDVEIGQSIERGGRLGQIDDPKQFKFSALIDEFYLGQVEVEQKASFTRDGVTYHLKVDKVYPQVKSGQFKIDLFFISHQPKGIRRGQTIQTNLTLGNSNKTLLIPNGAFYQETGGNWAFVVSEDGTYAYKRNISLGRRNNKTIEVLGGLVAGERVIVSPYSSYKEIDSLKLVDH